MDAKTFESIKTKVDTLKSKQAKAEGAMESIKADWLKNYKTADIVTGKHQKQIGRAHV